MDGQNLHKGDRRVIYSLNDELKVLLDLRRVRACYRRIQRRR